jgi:glutamyl-tRNA reductase
VVETITSQLVNKLLHHPTIRLKELAATPQDALYLAAARDLFGVTASITS